MRGWRVPAVALLGAGMVLAGCADTHGVRDLARDPLPVPAELRPVPVRFGEVRSTIRRGTPIGAYYWALDCAGPYNAVAWGARRDLLDRDALADLFHEELGLLGYDVAGDPRRLFDAEDDLRRAQYLVSADLADLHLRLCRRVHWLTRQDLGVYATAWLRVNWTLYSRLERRVLYRTTTEGSAGVDVASEYGDQVALENAFAVAAANLAADAGFQARLLDRPARGRPVTAQAASLPPWRCRAGPCSRRPCPPIRTTSWPPP